MASLPVGTTTGAAGLSHIDTVFLTRKGLDRLKRSTIFHTVCEKDSLPLQNGRVKRFFRYGQGSALTTKTVEGTVGSPVTTSTRTMDVTVSQYSSFMNFSDFVEETAIDALAQNHAEILAEQAALTVDQVIRAVIDAETGALRTPFGGANATASVSDLRANSTVLENLDTYRFADGFNKAIMHPYVIFDILNDPTAGGYGDTVKYTYPQSSSLIKTEDHGLKVTMADTKVFSSNQCKITAGTPNLYRAYTFTRGAIMSVDLAGKGPSYNDNRTSMFKVNMIPKAGPTPLDPEGIMGSAVSYNMKFGVAVMEGTATIGGPYRYLMNDFSSSLG